MTKQVIVLDILQIKLANALLMDYNKITQFPHPLRMAKLNWQKWNEKIELADYNQKDGIYMKKCNDLTFQPLEAVFIEG